MSPALLLGMVMVARGENGRLIIEIGYNNTSYVLSDGFMTAIWAILLNTIIGLIFVGVLIKMNGDDIGRGPWGVVPAPNQSKGEEKGNDDRFEAQTEGN